MLKVGIVGCGSIAAVHAWAIDQIEGIQLAACADCKLERAENLARQYEDVKAYGDLTDMLEEEAIEVLHICTPHYLHVPMAIEAMERGISVFMEKPAAITQEQFRELCSKVEKKKARIGFCFQNRYNATTKKLDELAESRELGRVTGARAFVTWRRDASYYTDTDWKGKWATEGGGVLINQSIHTLDLLLRYLGEPIHVASSMQNHHLQKVIEVEDTVEIQMEFAEGKRACFYASNAYVTDAPVILELQFERGSAQLCGQSILLQHDGKQTLINCEGNRGIGKNYWGNGHLACIRDFYDSRKKNRPFQNDLAGVSNTMKTMLQIYGEEKK